MSEILVDGLEIIAGIKRLANNEFQVLYFVEGFWYDSGIFDSHEAAVERVLKGYRKLWGLDPLVIEEEE